jgi:hypothetical protein
MEKIKLVISFSSFEKVFHADGTLRFFQHSVVGHQTLDVIQIFASRLSLFQFLDKHKIFSSITVKAFFTHRQSIVGGSGGFFLVFQQTGGFFSLPHLETE